MAEIDQTEAAASMDEKEQSEQMSKDVRLTIVEVMMLDKLSLRAMQAKLLKDFGVSINHVTLSRDVKQIKEALDLEKPGWDELSEEELLRETPARIRRRAARARPSGASGDSPGRARTDPLTDFEIGL